MNIKCGVDFALSLGKGAIPMSLNYVRSICRGFCMIFLAEYACLVTFLKTAVQAVSWNWKIQWWLEGLFSKSRKMHWEWIICLDTEGWVRENGPSRRQVGLKPRTLGNDCSEGQFQAQALRLSPCKTPSPSTQLLRSGFFQWSLT